MDRKSKERISREDMTNEETRDFLKCIGCIEFIKELQMCNSGLFPIFYNDTGKKFVCPCIRCLLKGICMTPCSLLSDYYNSFHKKIYEKYYKNVNPKINSVHTMVEINEGV
jgi:hypothetical protein